MIVTCPSCSTRFKYDDARFVGVPSKYFQCTACSKMFEVANPSIVNNAFAENEKGMPSSKSAAMPQTGYVIRLAFLTGPKSSTTMELTNPQTVIGRDEGDIMTMDPETSRLHAMIEIMCDGTVWLSDLGSTNGTVTNGVPVTDKAQLEDRQEFSCGKSAFMLLLDKK